jgi:hypothetical protein
MIDLVVGSLRSVRQPVEYVIGVLGVMNRTCSIQLPAFAGSPGAIVGGWYRLKQVAPGRSIHPPSRMSLSLMTMGRPGAQVICSTGLLRSSQALAGIKTGLPPLSTGPASSSSLTGGMRELTLAAGQGERVGV